MEKVSLKKFTISDNEQVSLKKDVKMSLKNVEFVCHWMGLKRAKGGLFEKIGLSFVNNIFERISKNVDIDLDVGVVLFDKNKNVLDYVNYSRCSNSNSSIYYPGDNRTGGSESIIIEDMTNIPNNVKYLAFCLNSYSSENLADIANFKIELKESGNGMLESTKNECNVDATAAFVAVMERDCDDWKLKPVWKYTNARTVTQMYDFVAENIL